MKRLYLLAALLCVFPVAVGAQGYLQCTNEELGFFRISYPTDWSVQGVQWYKLL